MGNYLDLEAFKTKLLFSGSYFGEKHFINWVNSRFRHYGLHGPCNHAVDLIEIEIDRNIGFFDFFLEDQQLFEAARDKSIAAFRNWREACIRAEEEAAQECLCSYGGD